MASKLKVNRGTTYTIGFNYRRNNVAEDLTGATVRFTVKSAEYDSDLADTTALITKNITSHTDPTAGESEIVINPTDTRSIVPGDYYFDIKVEDADGAIFKVVEGDFILDGSPTNRID